MTKVWILGDSHIYWATSQALRREGPQLGLEATHMITWKGRRGATLQQAVGILEEYPSSSCYGAPDLLLINLGTNDLLSMSSLGFHLTIQDFLSFCTSHMANTILVWCNILPRPYYYGAFNQGSLRRKRNTANRNARRAFIRAGHKNILVLDISPDNWALFRYDCLHLSPLGLDIFINTIKGALEYFHMFNLAIQFPPFNMM